MLRARRAAVQVAQASGSAAFSHTMALRPRSLTHAAVRGSAYHARDLCQSNAVERALSLLGTPPLLCPQLPSAPACVPLPSAPCASVCRARTFVLRSTCRSSRVAAGAHLISTRLQASRARLVTGVWPRYATSQCWWAGTAWPRLWLCRGAENRARASRSSGRRGHGVSAGRGRLARHWMR